MSATADENTRRDLLAVLPTDSGDSSAHGLWPAGPGPAEAAGQLRIDLDDGRTWSGSAVTVEARVTVPGHQEVLAVIRVQGLEPAWCPRPQVVTVFPGATARLYLRLTPAAGTPPGCYLWSLTAEVQDRPMLATTAQLHVDRPRPAALPPPRANWRPITGPTALIAVLLVMVVVAATVFAASQGFWRRDTTTRRPTPPAAAGPDRGTPTARPSAGATAEPGPADMVLVKGTVLAKEGKEPIQITVVRLNLNDLTGINPVPAGPSPVPGVPGAGKQVLGVGKQVHGEHWSLSLPPGLYGLTFSKAGYVSQSIVVAPAVADKVASPHVLLDRVIPTGR